MADEQNQDPITTGGGQTDDGNAGDDSSQQQSDFQTSIKLPPHPNTTFDELYFIRLLSVSISLSIDEKKKIIDAIPKLSQQQIDELIRIFEEEQRKFAELAEKHADQINKLRAQHAAEWEKFEMENQQAVKQEEDHSKVDDIRKQLGL